MSPAERAPRRRPLAAARMALGDLVIEQGEPVRGLELAYHAGGALPREDNVVVVLHALTGTSHVGTDWWREVVGPGCAIDTREYHVVAPVLPGSCYGTRWSSPAADAPPALTTRDLAAAVWLLLDQLGVETPALVTGGSLGGMVALEVSATRPEAVHRTVAFAAPAAHTAWAIGWHHVQREILEALGGDRGLALARAIATLSFRSEREFNGRFDRTRRETGRFSVQDYLDHQGRKLVARFDPGAWRVLTAAMDAHDVGRDRGGASAALRAIRGLVLGVGITGDVLYGEREIRAWTDDAGVSYTRLRSTHGHDGFLLEQRQVGRILRAALELPVRSAQHDARDPAGWAA